MKYYPFSNEGKPCLHVAQDSKNKTANQYHADHAHRYYECSCKVCGHQWYEKW